MQVYLYLTFDDGPNCGTNEVLDILASHKVKATFFINGKKIQVGKVVIVQDYLIRLFSLK